jgi:hypothetical protein
VGQQDQEEGEQQWQALVGGGEEGGGKEKRGARVEMNVEGRRMVMGRGRMGVRERKQVEVEEVEVGGCGR